MRYGYLNLCETDGVGFTVDAEMSSAYNRVASSVTVHGDVIQAEINAGDDVFARAVLCGFSCADADALF